MKLPLFFLCFFLLQYFSRSDAECTFKNLAFVLDSTKEVKPIEFDESRAKDFISKLISSLKFAGIRPVWYGRVYHSNDDCKQTRKLNETEHFGPKEGPGPVRAEIKKLKHFPSKDAFNISCAENHLFGEYEGDLNVGLIIAPYDSIIDKFSKKGMYGVFIYFGKVKKELILIHDDREKEKKIGEVVDVLKEFKCPTPPPPTPATPTPTSTPTPTHSVVSTPLSTHTSVYTTSSTPPLIETTSIVISTSTVVTTSVSTVQVTSTSIIRPTTSSRIATTHTPTTEAPPPTTTLPPESKLIHEIDQYMKINVDNFDKNESKNFMEIGIKLLKRIHQLYLHNETAVKLMDFLRKQLTRIGEVHSNKKIEVEGAVVESFKGKDFLGCEFKDGREKFSIDKSFFQSKEPADAQQSIVAIMEFPTLPVMTALKKTDTGEDIALKSFLGVAQHSGNKKVATALTKKISYTLHIRKGQNPNSKYKCVFWEKSSPTNGSWNGEDCQFKSIKDQHVSCECNYKATIAYSVMRLKPITDSTRFCLKLSTYIGCAVAGGVCLLIVMILVMFRKGLKYDQNVVHLNLALSIAVSNGLYVAADFAYKVKYLCMGVSIGIMYFYLATLFWILVESFHLYMLIVRRAKDTNMTMFYMIIGWVAPSIIVALTAALQRQYFLKEAFCWLKYDNWVIWTLVGPSLFIILLSVILLSLSLVSSFKLERSLAGVLKFQRVTKFVFALIPLIGLCWSAALLAVNEQDKEYYQYILTGINGAIALLGLLSFCLLSSSGKGAMTGTRSMSSMGKDNKGNDTSTLSLSVITEPAFHSKTNF